MVFKNELKLVYVIIMLLMIVSCGQKNTEQTSFSQQETLSVVAYDSITFKTSSEEYLYLGKRLYPSSSSGSVNNSISGELITLEGVGDTIFAFLNSEMLYNLGNPRLPYVNDSLLRDYYPKYYEVEIDEDIPYFAYLRSPMDYAEFVREESGIFYIGTALLRDTVLNVVGGIKIGMDKARVLSELGVPLDLIDKESFSLILCHGAVPSKIWYKKDPKLKKTLTPQKPTIQVYLSFEGGQLKLAYINSWIGYGDRREISF